MNEPAISRPKSGMSPQCILPPSFFRFLNLLNTISEWEVVFLTVLGIVGLILAIAVLIILCYKGFSALPATLIAAFVAIKFNGMPVRCLQQVLHNRLRLCAEFLFYVVSAALYAKQMELSGLRHAIAYKHIVFGAMRAKLVSNIKFSELTYGGVRSWWVFCSCVTSCLCSSSGKSATAPVMAALMTASATKT